MLESFTDESANSPRSKRAFPSFSVILSSLLRFLSFISVSHSNRKLPIRRIYSPGYDDRLLLRIVYSEKHKDERSYVRSKNLVKKIIIRETSVRFRDEKLFLYSLGYGDQVSSIPKNLKKKDREFALKN